MFGFFWTYHRPQIKKWILLEAERQSALHLPVRIWAEDANVSLFPPRVSLYNVKYLPKDRKLAEHLAPGTIGEITVELGIGSLLRGQIRVADIIVIRPQARILFKTPLFNGSSASAETTLPLQAIAKLPIDDVHIEGADIMVGLRAEHVGVHLQNFSFQAYNRYRSIFVNLKTPHLFIKELGHPDGVPFDVETRFLISPEELDMTALKIKKDKSFLVAAGQIQGPLEKLKFKEADMKMRISYFLPELNDLLRVVAPQIKVPKLQGKANLDLSLTLLSEKLSPEVRFRIKTEDVKVDKFLVGNVSGAGTLDRNKFESDEISFVTPAGHASLRLIKMAFGERTTIESRLNVEKLELQQLLFDLGVVRVPLHLDIAGDVPCNGELAPKFNVICHGSLDAQNFSVWQRSDPKKIIVALKKMTATGQVRFDLQHVDYHASAEVGSSRGKSDGVIDYDKGFHINYESDLLNFKDVDNLVSLKLEGQAKVKGSTEGDGSRATFALDLNTQDSWIEDFQLGHFSTAMQYKTGSIYFRKILGHNHNSRFDGNLTIDVIRNQLDLGLHFPYVELDDITRALSRRLPLPIKIGGTGVAEVKAHGPLKINALSYQLKSTFYRGDIANEPFDEAKINISAENGYAKTNSVYLTKDASVIGFNGTMDPNWMVNAALIGNRLRLEQFDTVQRMGLSTTGLMDFAMTLHGPLPRPEMDLKGYFRKVVVGDQAVDDSNFELQFKKDRIEARGEFLGKTVVTHSTWPRDDIAPFDFYVKTQNWDFARIFSLISDPHHTNEFETALTGEVSLKSSQGGFWHANGKAEIQTLSVKHGSLSLSNQKPLVISFINGLMRTEFFELSGENAAVKLETLSTSREQIDLRLSGHFDLNLISVLTPFLSDLRGPVDFNMTAKGSLDDPNLRGSAFLEKGFLRFKEFPHAFENIHAGLSLNKSHLHIDALTATLGGGRMSADGQMSFLGGSQVPVDVAGQFQNVTLNVPDGFKTKGSGNFKFSGDHFPYLLTLNYNISGGDLTREFVQTPSLTKQVQPSTFLPKYFDQQSFEPLILDFTANFDSPINVKNALVSGNVTGHIKAEGTPKKIRLTGRAQAQKGSKIFFRDTPFDVEVGSVEYHEEAPENPLIYAQGKSRVTEVSTDNRPQTYDVDLILQGHPKDLKINLSSQPALSQQQIVSLLALGMTMDNNAISATASRSTEAQSSALTTQGSVQLGTALLQKPIGNQIKDKLGVDMQISSAYSQADQTTVPKVTFSKQWTPTFIGSASRTIDKSPVNLIKLEYKMERNLSLVGSWQGQSSDSTSLPNLQQPQVDPTPSIFGLDLEYKIEFK